MTVTALPVIKNGCLMVNGKVVLTRVPDNVVVTRAGSAGSAFIGASSAESSSRHVFTLGTLENCKFMCLFIAKIWWMIPRVGTSAREIPMETQMLLLEAQEESAFDLSDNSDNDLEDNNKSYILVLPVLDGSFRTTLQGTKSNELQFCYESGDRNVRTSMAMEGVFVNSGDNPFELLKDSIKILATLKGTFSHLDNKKIPGHLDWFGWCTWDAFYTQVTPAGIEEGLQSFKEGGISPKFLIIDDGWQETSNEFEKEGEPMIEGTQFATRLTGIKENNKFKNTVDTNGSTENLKGLIHHIKENYGLKYVYMWHALAGYWGGVQASSDALKKYNPTLSYPVLSDGNVGNIRDIALDSLEKYGVGVVDPEKVRDFYNDMHSYLASCGADGVKVDVQNLLGTLGEGHGGRVSVTRKYHEALDESVEKNFVDNNLICCMCHNSDSIFNSKKSATARASEDFMPNEPTFQTLHIASVSYNSLLLGEVFVPDWDMFHSDHNTAGFHGAARAIGGCPVYVSDKPGKQDFKILRKLVLPDGSVLRARHAGRPTRDCLFIDPVMDGKSLLKIWNLNKITGVVGVFNCQGAGAWPMKQARSDMPETTSISGHVKPLDVEFLEEIAGETWTDDCAVYAFNSGSLSRVRKNKSIKVSLNVLQCEVFTVSPIKTFNQSIEFAPIGLIHMYNSGGAIENCAFEENRVSIKARGYGVFGAYSNMKPSCCKVDNKNEDFTYDFENGFLTMNLEGECGLKEIEVLY
ncbi:probable galactinol--sucrose galactosyltransferase 2 [Andrographis paniculata]|uniref:probable galactinol--sucrose galactosyltransferase 2 n=1 Tax=Andrographis paniculata TaxID=175694 RepID=UPI0021E752C7|nr:probable galactinol--sucrose galactosyltransferase 2 [Andrographis paniculata]